jgi:phosphate transport system protein
MTDLVQQQVKTVRDAHAAHDLPAAMTAWRATRKSTPSAPRYFARHSDPRNISFCVRLMLSAKNIARMGGHATNIAG